MGAVPKYQCKGKCSITAKPDKLTLDTLETGFRNLFDSDSESLLKKYLTRTIFDNLKFKKTSYGSTLLDCIQTGLTHYDSNIGIYAADPDAYTAFAEIFDPILEDYHNGFKSSDAHPEVDFGDGNTIGNLDPSKKYVVSVRIRVGRSIKGFPFNPRLTEDEYKDLEKKIGIALAGLQGEIAGTYNPLCGMDQEVKQRLIEQHYLFKEGDKFLQAGNACRFWPAGRGIFFNEEKTFLVWVNEEDHMRIISMEYGGNLGSVYRRLVNGIAEIQKKIEFVTHPKFGYLTFCPTNLGTTLRASVHIKIPKLAKKKDKLDAAILRLNLQLRGTSGEHSDLKDGIYDISNKRRLGITEYEAVKSLETGIKELIKIENSIKVKKKRPPTEMELARRRLRKNPKLKRLKWPKFLPYFLYKI